MTTLTFTRTPVTLALSAALSLGACGDSSSDDLNGGGSIAIDDVPEALGDAFCDAYERCLGPLAEAAFPADCATEQTKAIEDGDFASVKDAIEKGTVKYDGAKMQACIDVIKTIPCEDLQFRDIPECEAAVPGTVDPGGDCDLDAECKSGTFCQVGAACPGTCTQRLALGDACENDDNCEGGLVCSPATNVCMREAMVGDACGGGTGPECALGLVCNGENRDQQIAGMCANPDDVFTAAKGATCNPSGPLCVLGVHCAVIGGGAAGLEFECKATAANGAACNLAIPDICPEGQACNLTTQDLMAGMLEGSCVDLPGAGKDCVGEFGRGCADGHVCVSGKCEARQRIGGKCSDPSVCYSETCTGGVCVQKSQCG